MGQDGPALALIDPDACRRARLAALASALGVPCSALASPPARPPAGNARVRVVLSHAGSDAAAIAALRAAFPAARVIVCAPDASQQAAIAAFRAGADDVFRHGAGDAELAALLADVSDGDRRLPAEVPHGPPEGAEDGLVGSSPAMRQLRAFLRRLAPSAATVLLTGETGTGKDVAALLIHRRSNRATGPLVALNCAAIPDTLLESELFGHERGAFSGAVAAYPGKLKLADGGTLLLDEVGELSLAGQAKVLRALEAREAYRIGARTPTRFDIRLVAATNRDLAAEVRAGRFRQDLYYRLAVAEVRMPPLRERRADILPTARHMLALMAGNGPPSTLTREATLRLEAHEWPGNARELRNALEVAVVTRGTGAIRATDLPSALGVAPLRRRNSLDDERSALAAALARAGGNKSLAAQELSCSRMTLYRRMLRCGLATGADVAVSRGL
jgi:DNA-binding NtrC family response regulator